jgi:hypothetical protein
VCRRSPIHPVFLRAERRRIQICGQPSLVRLAWLTFTHRLLQAIHMVSSFCDFAQGDEEMSFCGAR